MKRRLVLAASLILLVINSFSSCYSANLLISDGRLRGRMLLWHSWTGAEAEALAAVVEAFAELNPNVTVKLQTFEDPDEMRLQFLSAVSSGLGPDLLLAPSNWLGELVSANSIEPIGAQTPQEVLARYMPAALDVLRLQDQLYGLPQSLNVPGLYYNRRLVDQPAATLDQLLAQAGEGQVVLLPTNFQDAFWGVQAFGGRLFDQEGRTILHQGGFANWLAWLQNARNVPGMILDNNREALRARFLEGEAAYYVGYSAELGLIREALGAEAVGVAPLPAGPIAEAGPFLGVQAYFFSKVSSENQRRLALAFAQFATNTGQSGALMRQAQQTPANRLVRINPRLNPVVASFADQARSAVPMPNRADMERVMQLGTEAYNRVLEEGAPPAEVAFETANAINELSGFPVAEAPATGCTALGTIRLAHTWEERSAAALDELIQRFHEICPLVIINTVPVNEDLLRTALAGGSAATQPAFALSAQRQLLSLTEAPPLLANLTPVVTAESLQKFWPIAVEAMRVQGTLYGLPAALSVDALYYNRALVETPAQVLADLRSQAGRGVPIVLETGFVEAFWGIGAFGGRLFDGEYRVVLNQGGFAEWLAWLKESRDSFGIQLSADSADVRARFERGESAYYVGGPDELADLEAALGDRLGVALLPSGPAGSAQPLARADGFFFRDTTAEGPSPLALQFANFVTEAEAQAHLLQAADRLPANATLDLSREPVMEVFAAQLSTGVLIPNSPNWEAVQRLGDNAYSAVLQEGQDPVAAVAEVTQQINDANNLSTLPAPAPTPEGEGTATPGATAPAAEPAATATGVTGTVEAGIGETETGEADETTSTPPAAAPVEGSPQP